MSRLITIVSKIESCDNLHIVQFDFNGQILTMMSLELSDAVKVGSKVVLAIKPTHVAIGKGSLGSLSYSNQLKCKIDTIENGKLLVSLVLNLGDDVLIESIITKNSANRLELKDLDDVTAIIKASDISISEILDA